MRSRDRSGNAMVKQLSVLAIAIALGATLLALASTAAVAGPAGAAKVRPAKWELNEPVPGGLFYSITCPTSTDCAAVGSTGLFVTSSGGAGWTGYTNPAGTSGLTAIACPTVSNCHVVGYEDQSIDGRSYQAGVALGLSLSASGPTWSTETVPDPTGDQVAPEYTSVSCPSATDCYVGGEPSIAAPEPGFFATSNGGARWSVTSLPSGTGEFNALTCPVTPSDTTCYATDYSSGHFAVTTNGGSNWSVAAAPKPYNGMQAIACPSATECISSGDGGAFVTTDSGAAWSWHKAAKASNLYGISCSTTADCTAVGITVAKSGPAAYIVATVNGGSTWRHVATPAETYAYDLTGVSCPSTTSCFAVGPWQDNDGTYVLSAVSS